MTSSESLFEVETRLGFRVRVPANRWELIVTLKHPVMRGRESDVERTLRDPDEIRQSKIDSSVSDGCRQRGKPHMDKVRVFYDREGETLTVWFDDPANESVAEETGEDVILIKNAEGRVIGFEKLHFVASDPQHLDVAFEAAGV